jgi:Fe-S cluster biogenesis protein NfuA
MWAVNFINFSGVPGMCEHCGCNHEKGLKDKIAEVIDSIRPMLQNDGGDIEFVELAEDNSVKVRLQGACRGCPGAQMTLKMGVERLLKERVPEVKEVIAVN